MVSFTWRDYFEIGIDFIDDDHKHLLEIMKDIQNAINASEHNRSITLLNKLITEANNHFQREEQYLKEVKYPRLAEHKKYHRELIIRADTTKQICEGIKHEDDLKTCFDSMANFLIDDIFHGDIQFKSYLEFHGHIKRKH